jgi:succinate dehydrogenase / fumarate reductase cytochrome b subunit
MTDAPRARPLSPHLQVWRWHATMLTSILHRATGVGLYVGALVLTAWLVALALGDDAYAAVMGLLGSPLGLIVMIGLTFSAFFHLAKGIQHLIWDFGSGFKLPSANMGAIVCIAFAVVATAVIFVIAWMTGAVS